MTSYSLVLLALLAVAPAPRPPGVRVTPTRIPQDRCPPRIATYLPFFVSYARHAESLWHAHSDGGYWGDGRADGNGGVRGCSNLTLAYAMLVHAEDRGWLTVAQTETLAGLDLDRSARLARVRAAWRYLASSHRSGSGACADGEQWGRSWQSSLWVGASGLAALLVWNELDAPLRAQIERVVVDEADRKIDAQPRDASPGNTAAEENGWDTHAPAIAVALFPDHPHAGAWLRAAQVFAANTLSVAADRDSDAMLGDDRVRDIVTTANLFDDFTLDNHGFFHPSYLKVSVQELGEALLMLALGDQRHGTANAARLRPYALHHVADAWQVMKRLLLPDGEYAFPSGSDWALHLPSSSSYLAFVTTALGDPLAALAERRAFTAAQVQQRASSDGRFLGGTNFEWWWEPIVLKRFATAVLQFELCPDAVEPVVDRDAWNDTTTWWSEPTRVFVHRTPLYFASVSIRKQPTGLVIPLGPRHLDHPFLTTPRLDSLLPAGAVASHARHDHELGSAFVMRYESGVSAAVIALRNTVMFVADDAIGALGIQNDPVVTELGRSLRWASGTKVVPPLSAMDEFSVPGPWLCIDGELGLIAAGGFRYRPAGEYTRRSAAEDLVAVTQEDGHTGLLVAPRCNAEETAGLAAAFSVEQVGQHLELRCQDGVDGAKVRIVIGLAPHARTVHPTAIAASGPVSAQHPITNLIDGRPTTFAVLTNTRDTGPSPDAPIELEFSAPAAAAAASAVRLTPRPRYGPKSVTLMAHTATGWHAIASAELDFEPVDLAMPANRRAARYKLVVSQGWDRGEHVATPRNTQIAELAFVLEPGPDPAAARSAPSFELQVLSSGDR